MNSDRAVASLTLQYIQICVALERGDEVEILTDGMETVGNRLAATMVRNLKRSPLRDRIEITEKPNGEGYDIRRKDQSDG